MNSFFDALEQRMVLSAPVATVESVGITPDEMTVVVRYSADTGIDRETINTDDIVVNGPDRARRAVHLSLTPTWEGPDVVVRYYIGKEDSVPHDQWANGTYNLGILPGAVRSQDGAGNAATGAGSYWLWYPDTYVSMDFAWLRIAEDGWTLQLTRWTRHPDAQTTMSTSVRITGPHGDEVFQSQGVYSAYKNTVRIVGENSTGPWSYTDTGTYSIAVGEYDGAQLAGFRPVEQRFVWGYAPKVEILSTDFSDTEVLITARFSGRSAIDPSSVGWQAIEADVGAHHIWAVDHELVLDPRPDGSVIGTFKLSTGDNSSWGSAENGDWRYVANQDYNLRVRDVEGYHAGSGVIMHQWHAFTTVSTDFTEMAAHAPDPRTLTFKMAFPALNVDLATLGGDDIRLELNGRSYQLSLAYTFNSGWSPDWGQQITAAYTLTLPQGERLDTGTARFYVNAGAISISGQPSSEQFMGSWWLWFN